MIAGRLDGCLAGRMEQFLNGSAQDKAEPKMVRLLASSLEAERMNSFIFQVLEATCSEVAHAQNTIVGPYPCSGQSAVNMDIEKLIACVFCRPSLWNQANPDHHNLYVI